MADAMLLAYVEAIESRLRSLRGRERLLAPPEFALARRWCAAGVPLALVLEVVERTYAERGELTSIVTVQRELARRLRGVSAPPR